MKVTSPLLDALHLQKTYCLLPGRNVKLLYEFFKLLDIHNEHALNDVQFQMLMRQITDLDETRIYKVFDMLDTDCSGSIDFNEFYLLVCILIAVKDDMIKTFIYRHSRTVFDLLDEDQSGTISAHEFEVFGFLFNMDKDCIKDIFDEFDVSGDQNLDYSEFKMFAMECIDRQHDKNPNVKGGITQGNCLIM